MAGQKQRTKILSTSALTLGLVALGAHAAVAMDDFTTPTGEQVVGGQATFDRPDTGVLNINQGTDRAVINWDSFNIGKKGKTEFFQPNSGSLAVNRVTGQNADPTQILGSLKANGRIMVLDRNGVFFGKDAVIDVGGIVASTGDVDNAAVMRGDSKLGLSNFGDGSIVNEGLVRVGDAGLAAFVAPHVANNGVIEARLGKVALASGGERATVDLYGDGLVEIAVDGQKGKALVENNGTIDAEGGTVLMTADAAKDIVDDVINMNGTVKVSSVTMKGGKIILSGGSSGKVNVKGTLDASGENGGRIDVRGKDIDVGAGALLTADGGQNGNGGEIIVFGDNYAVLNGRAFARGGVLGGNGGFVELSAKETVGFEGFVSTFAESGALGTFLIDPRFIIIHSGTANSAGALTARSVISASALADAMSSTNIILQANSFIDVGTRDSYANIPLQAGETIPNNLGNGSIDLSASKVAGGSTLPPPSNGCNGVGNPHCADIGSATTGNLTLQSNEINFNRDLIMGLGNLKIEGNPGGFAPNVNIKSVIFGLDDYTATTPNSKTVTLSKKVVLGDDRIDSNAINITVLNDDALIQQAVWLSTAGSTINVQPGTYDESVTYNTVELTGFDEIKVKGKVAGYEPIYTHKVETYTGHGITLDRANLTIRATGNINNNPNTTARGAESVIDPNSPGFHVTANGVTINGFTINTGDDGVLVDNADNVTITNTIFTNQTSSAVRTINGSDNVNVINNAMTLNSGVYGVALNGGSNHDVTGNTITGGVRGVQMLSTASGNNVLNNTITGTSDNAISVFANTGATNVSNNHIFNTGWDGINVHSGTGFVTLQNNDIHNTTGASGIAFIGHSGDALVSGNTIDGADRLGIYVWNSNGLDISGNTISDTGREAGWWTSGIHLEGANDTTVQGNTIRNSGGDAIHVGGNGNAGAVQTTGNKILNNIIGTAGAGDIHGDGIYSNDSDGIVITGNTITDTARTGEYNKGSGIQVVNTTGATIGATGKGNANVITNAGWDGIRVADSSGVTVQKNVITADATDNDARVGIYFGNVTGSAIKGNTVGNANRYAAIYTEGGANLSVVNNTVVNSDEAGILMQNAGGQNDITGNTVDQTGQNVKPSDGSGSGDGIKVVGSYGSADSDDADLLPDTGVLVGNNSVGMSGGDIRGNGIYVLGSTHTLVRNNDVNDTDGDGVKLENTDFANVRANTISNVTRVGIYGGNTTNTTIHNNTLVNGNTTLSGYGAISTDFGSNLTVTGNDIDGSAGHGIRINGAGGTNLIRNNDVDGVAYDGIRGENVSNLTIASNEIGLLSAIGGNGVSVIDSASSVIEENQIANVTGSGIFVDPSHDTVVYSNTITGGLNGIYVLDSNRVKVGAEGKANVITGSDTGILLVNSDDASVSYNQISNTGSDGIHARRTNDLLITENNVYGAGGDGVFVRNSNHAHILDNHISSASANGISTRGVDDVSIAGNDVLMSGANGIKIARSSEAYVYDNNVLLSMRDGVFVRNTDYSSIDDNVVVLSLGNGIHVDGGNETSIRGNLVALSAIDGITVENTGGDQCGWSEVYGLSEGGSPNWNVRIAGNDVVLSGRHGISAFDTGSVQIRNNEVALSGTNFIGWIEDVIGGGSGFETASLVAEDGPESIFDYGFILGWGNGDGIHVEGAYRPSGYEGGYGDFRIASIEGGDYSPARPAVSIVGNDVRWSGGDGIEVRDSGSVRIARNYVEASGINATAFTLGGLLSHFSSLDLGGVFDGFEGILSGETGMNDFLAEVLPPPEFTFWGNSDGIHVENVQGDDNFGGYGFEGFDALGKRDFAVRIRNNEVVGTGGDGIEVRDSGWTLVAGNTVTTTGLLTDFYGPFPSDSMTDRKVKGPFMDDHEDWLYSGNGISVNNGQFDGPSIFSLEKGYYGPESVAVLRNNTVTDAGQNGIMTETVDHLLVDSNVVLNSGAANLFVAGAYNGDVVLTGNTFTFDNEVEDGVEQIGALFESGIIDLTGESNTFNGGTKGMVFSPAQTNQFPFPFPFPFIFEGGFEGPEASFAHMELVDNTIGTTVFNGQKTYYVELANGAFFNPGTPTVLNGLNATYDGFRPANVGGILTQAQYDAIEAKIFHYNDLASLGLFFFGLVPNDIDQEDIFNKFNGFTGNIGPIRITLLGLPNLPGNGGLANFLANIAPAAGGEEDEYETVFDLADIEPASGGDNTSSEASCWSEAAAQASAGATASYSFGSSAEEALSQTAGCSF